MADAPSPDSPAGMRCAGFRLMSKIHLPHIATPAWKYGIGLCWSASASFLYLLTNQLNLGSHGSSLMTNLDRQIPFIPVSGWVYVAQYFFILVAFVITTDLARTARFLYAW